MITQKTMLALVLSVASAVGCSDANSPGSSTFLPKPDDPQQQNTVANEFSQRFMEHAKRQNEELIDDLDRLADMIESGVGTEQLTKLRVSVAVRFQHRLSGHLTDDQRSQLKSEFDSEIERAMNRLPVSMQDLIRNRTVMASPF